jgi:RimJ/RimL family protein N-acetyltransferase
LKKELLLKNPFLIGDSVYLRAPEPGDESVHAQTVNHPALREHLFYALPQSAQQYQEAIKKWMEDNHSIIFTICTSDPDKPIGLCAFFRIDWIGRMATYYIAIADPENWSRGFGKEVTRLMVHYGFNTLNLNRIQLHVACNNNRAIKVYKQIGFQEEGTLRQAMYYNNKYVDFFLMSILRSDKKEL